MNTERINRSVQDVTLQFISYVGEIASIAKFVVASMGEQAPPLEELVNYLKKTESHKELLRYEVGLWRNTAGSWSLVSLATPPTIEAMRYRLEHFPTSNTQCRWCLQDAKRLAHIDLVAEKDIRGEPVHNSRCHLVCLRPWLAMRNQVDRNDAAPKKESLI